MKKTFNYLILNLILFSCGKNLDSSTKSELENSKGGFTFTNALFESTNKECNGNIGVKIVYGLFTDTENLTKENASLTMEKFACSSEKRDLNEMEDKINLTENKNIAGKNSNPNDNNEKEFIDLCNQTANKNLANSFSVLAKISNITFKLAEPESKESDNNDCNALYSHLKTLDTLNLKDQNISELKPLKYLTQLKKLDLTGNPIKEGAEISSLKLNVLVMDQSAPLSDNQRIYKFQ